MGSETQPEHYKIIIDGAVSSKEALFSRVTDTAYLGYSSFSGWDAFREMFRGRIECSNIILEIVNYDLTALNDRDRIIWLEILNEAKADFQEKLVIAF